MCPHCRDRDDREVDLVLVKGDTLWPLEVKLTSRPDGRTARQLQIASKFNLIQGHGAIVCRTDRWAPLSETADPVPVGIL